MSTGRIYGQYPMLGGMRKIDLKSDAHQQKRMACTHPKRCQPGSYQNRMLNLGAEYVWLDVLCLRRRGGLRDDLCEDEWELDVRTVGNVYKTAKTVVCYFSGLGLPFRFSMDDFASTRSWFRRAWLLQQLNESYIIGGDTVGGDSEQNLAILEEDVRTRFCEQLSALVHIYRSSVFNVLRHMEGRVSTHAVDRVAGLAYLLHSRKIPRTMRPRVRRMHVNVGGYNGRETPGTASLPVSPNLGKDANDGDHRGTRS